MQNEVNELMKRFWIDHEFHSSYALIQLSELIICYISLPCLSLRFVKTRKVVLTIDKIFTY